MRNFSRPIPHEQGPPTWPASSILAVFWPNLFVPLNLSLLVYPRGHTFKTLCIHTVLDDNNNRIPPMAIFVVSTRDFGTAKSRILGAISPTPLPPPYLNLLLHPINETFITLHIHTISNEYSDIMPIAAIFIVVTGSTNVPSHSQSGPRFFMPKVLVVMCIFSNITLYHFLDTQKQMK